VIKARDNSSNHNTSQLPAAGYYRFRITSQAFTSFCKQTYLPIRDNLISYDTLVVSAYGTVVDLNFKMESLIHTYDGDIMFSITPPSGSEVILSNRRGSSGDNFINTIFDDSAATPIANGSAPFTGTFSPESPLSVINGQPIHGNWVLKVFDQGTGDTGRVERYCLNILYNSILSVANNQLPLKYELRQNYPNPFNPVTKISFSIPHQTIVTIKIYDILGREVETLVNGIKNAGNYEVEWNAGNYASGVYFYRIETGEFTDVKKMVVLK
jgi:subtilisin-like proprotein convertase family protein